MSVTFNESSEVRELANTLIFQNHPDLVEHRVRIEYIFSDQVIERHGKIRWGDCAKVSGKNAFMFRRQEESLYLPYTWVCTRCRRWKYEATKKPMAIKNETFDFCDDCYREVSVTVLWNPNALQIVREWRNIADIRVLDGPPEPSEFFLITIYKDVWEGLRDIEKSYLVDHELMHCGTEWDKDGNSRLFIRPHDLEEFEACVNLYGPYVKGDIEKMYRSMKSSDTQLSLFETKDVEKPILTQFSSTSARSF